MADVLKDFEGYSKISEKIRKFCPRILATSSAATKRDENALNVLCHGDLWSSNIMFTHDAVGQPSDAIIFDYQGCYWGPIILDIINVFYTSSNVELQEHDWSSLTEFYYKELTDLLAKLKYPKDVPSLEEIQSERNARGFASMPMAFCSLALRNMDEVDDFAITKMVGNEDGDKKFREQLLSNPKIRRNLEFLVNYFNNLGYFD